MMIPRDSGPKASSNVEKETFPMIGSAGSSGQDEEGAYHSSSPQD
jgi:hypothetical protein